MRRLYLVSVSIGELHLDKHLFQAAYVLFFLPFMYIIQ